MSDGILLAAVPRGTLLDERARVLRLDEALPQIEAALAGEDDAVAIQATLASLLWDAMPHASWCGFYRRVGVSELAVGPYQGPMGCLRIVFTRGVCGAAARTKEVQLVPDVDAFPDHIACDDKTRSELVLPVICAGDVRAVLDLDSRHLAAFGREEATRLQGLLGRLFDRGAVVW